MLHPPRGRGRRRHLALALAVAGAVVSATTTRVAAEPKRPIPEYDGRAEGTTAGDVALWAPRVLLAPAWVAHWFGVRAPIRALILIVDRPAAAETGPRWPGSERTSFRPLLEVDYGFAPRFGFATSFDRGGTPLRLHAEAGTAGFAMGAAQTVDVARGRAFLEAHGFVDRRDDAIFHGLGPRSRPEDRRRIGVEKGEAAVAAVMAPTPHFDLVTAIGVRGGTVRGGGPEFEDWLLFVQRIRVGLDSRRPIVEPVLRPTPRWTDGVRVELEAEHASMAPRAGSWITWGARAFATIDVTGERRILELGATMRFLSPLRTGGDDVPLLERVALGGDGPLRGHLAGRLYGDSALVATARWRWPIWVWLDGFLEAEAGNVYGRALEGLRPGSLRLSTMTGIRNHGLSPYRFEIAVGGATEPIDEGARPSSLRLLVTAWRPL
jgi:hypothetical protein